MNSRRGLTLVEVLMALTLLGIGTVVLLTATSRCIAVARRARHYENARRLIGRLTWEQPLPVEELEEGVEEGAFDRPFEDYRWQRSVEQVIEEDEEPEEDDSGLFRVTTRITWSDRGRRQDETVTTMIYIPPGQLDESF